MYVKKKNEEHTNAFMHYVISYIRMCHRNGNSYA